MLACSHATHPGCWVFGLWGRMAKHLSNRGLAVWQVGMLGSPTQGLGGPEGGLISERFEGGSTGDDAPPPLAVLPPTQIRSPVGWSTQPPGASHTHC